MNLKKMLGMILIFSCLVMFHIPVSSQSSNTPFLKESNISLQTDNISLPVISVDNNRTQYGSSIDFAVGMLNATNTTLQYVSGYTFEVYLEQVNFSRQLVNGTTTSEMYDYSIPTYNAEESSRILPGNYSLFFLVNATTRGFLNASTSIEIFSSSNAQVQFSLHQIGRQGFDRNRTELYDLIIENIGLANAFQIEVNIQSIEDPAGLIHNSSFPFSLDVLLAGNETTISFTMTPTRFGIGSVVFQSKYSDFSGQSTTGILTLVVEVLPRVTPSFFIQPEIYQGNISTVSISIQNTESVPIQISMDLVSDKIFFFNDPGQLIEINNFYSKDVTGSVISTGVGFISITVYYYDDDTVGRSVLFKRTFEIEIGDVIEIIDPVEPDNSFLILFTIVLILFLIVIGFILVLIFSTRIRYRIMSQFLPERLNRSLSFPKNSIIVDGSNVAWDNPTRNGKANLDNIILASNELKKSGFNMITIIVDAALRYQVENTKKFDKETRKGTFKVLPAKVSGDLFILRLSKETEAMILTNDLFKEFRDEFPFIDERRVPFSILNDSFFLHPLAIDQNGE